MIAEIRNGGGWKSPQVIGALLAALLTIMGSVQAWSISRLASLEERADARASVTAISDREMVRVVGILAERVSILEGGASSWLPEIRGRLERIERRLDELSVGQAK